MLAIRLAFNFSTAPLKRYGIQPQAMPVLPRINFPIRQYVEGQKQIAKKDIYEFLDYQKKQFPRCRYFVHEHKGQIYHVFDSSRYPFGKMMSKIATLVRGKNTPIFKNNEVNQGQIAIIVNARDPLFTGKKLRYKQLIYHTGFVGHLKRQSYKDLMLRRPQLLYYHALNKFLPKNKLRKPYFNNLYVFREKTHNFSFLPQFAPDKNIYEGLPETNLFETILNSPDTKVVNETHPGLAKQIFGKDMPIEQKNNQDQDEQSDEKKYVYDISKAQFERLKKRQAILQNRYKRVGAIKKKRVEQKKDWTYYSSESQIKRSPYYEILKQQQVDQDEQEIIKDVFGLAKQGQKTGKKQDVKAKDPKKK